MPRTATQIDAAVLAGVLFTVSCASAQQEAPPAPLRRAPYDVILDSPLRDSTANSAAYGLGMVTLGAGFEWLDKHSPSSSHHWGWRGAELAATIGAAVPWTILSHEAAHYRAAKSLGCNPRISLNWDRGMTYYDGCTLGNRDRLVVAAAGLNQDGLSANHLYGYWARNHSVTHQEALAYAIRSLGLSLYNVRNRLPAGSDDLRTYAAGLSMRGHSLSRSRLRNLGIATTALSVPAWAALLGEYRFLAGGGRQVEMPSFSLFGVDLAFPTLHVLLAPDTPIVGAALHSFRETQYPLELTLHRAIYGEATGLGATVYDLPLGSHLTLSPSLRATLGSDPGILASLRLRVRIDEYWSVGLRLAYREDDMLQVVEGFDDGFDAHLSWGVQF